MTGKFISFEGGDGAGKSTQLSLLSGDLEALGRRVILTREPGGTRLSEQIRSWVLHESDALCKQAELLLIFAARAQHISEVIRPALLRGDWVLCDRFTDASYAYQGGGRGIPVGFIQQIEAVSTEGMRPDLTLLLDLPVIQGIERSVGRGQGSDRFEEQDLEFKRRVRQAYLDRQSDEPDRIRMIDATKSVESVHTQIWDLVSNLIEREDG
ncbi:MAG: dTMP kinase [Acidiferrobacteraceae bacterium]|nr:dTMP kinase [Acidiferrobacteraceae bacterium]MBT3639496.1 dTMP kinase [Acidiferrobacteraceae bacterium]MBT3771229.1 dTMP kinase [Acidiferrobacteraceae bacterium]MBT4394000.1 dTMP kinase [Acidiferrobacteraceae bacterium]MBT4403665.1 dTMP kinase [Acidiferrobacteraceae bacterium]